jgi:hypothetical protein
VGRSKIREDNMELSIFTQQFFMLFMVKNHPVHPE